MKCLGGKFWAFWAPPSPNGNPINADLCSISEAWSGKTAYENGTSLGVSIMVLWTILSEDKIGTKWDTIRMTCEAMVTDNCSDF
jgi:hypothetical protein